MTSTAYLELSKSDLDLALPLRGRLLWCLRFWEPPARQIMLWVGHLVMVNSLSSTLNMHGRNDSPILESIAQVCSILFDNKAPCDV